MSNSCTEQIFTKIFTVYCTYRYNNLYYSQKMILYMMITNDLGQLRKSNLTVG
jgi:hypothetical protein